jgi:hypothetical protein
MVMYLYMARLYKRYTGDERVVLMVMEVWRGSGWVR